ncbi:MAG: type II toxin-antitoxin system PemK/MazF family toxin [Spirochaetales bacterium]
MTDTLPRRGEIWNVNFDPTIGAEIKKLRPALVISPDSIGKLPLCIVVPVTNWADSFEALPWIVRLRPTRENGLSKTSGADCFQVKSVARERFTEKSGSVTAEELDLVVSAIQLCIGVY